MRVRRTNRAPAPIASLPSRVDNYEHLSDWDEKQKRVYRQSKNHVRGANVRDEIRSLMEEIDEEARSPSDDPMSRRQAREFDTLGGGLLIQRREFDSLGEELPVKKSLRTVREFDSLGGGLIVPFKKNSVPSAREFDSLGDGLIVPSKKNSVQSAREFDSLGGGLISPHKKSLRPAREFDSLGGGLILPTKKNHIRAAREFDSLGGGLIVPFKKSNVQTSARSFVDSDDVDELAGVKQHSSDGKPSRSKHVGFRGLTAARHGIAGRVWNRSFEVDEAPEATKREFDSLGGELILPDKRRANDVNAN